MERYDRIEMPQDKISFPEMELEILAKWDRERTFEE